MREFRVTEYTINVVPAEHPLRNVYSDMDIHKIKIRRINESEWVIQYFSSYFDRDLKITSPDRIDSLDERFKFTLTESYGIARKAADVQLEFLESLGKRKGNFDVSHATP